MKARRTHGIYCYSIIIYFLTKNPLFAILSLFAFLLEFWDITELDVNFLA
jgi:hypothetical protein